jgi:hypothetical protein
VALQTLEGNAMAEVKRGVLIERMRFHASPGGLACGCVGCGAATVNEPMAVLVVAGAGLPLVLGIPARICLSNF